jgi:hypothetical protein
MHNFLRTITPPPFLWLYAVVGQTSAQGAGLQARQRLALKPVDSPPVDSMRMPAQLQESFLWMSLAQASEHEWHPVH